MQKSRFEKIRPWTSFIVNEWWMNLEILDILMGLVIALFLVLRILSLTNSCLSINIPKLLTLGANIHSNSRVVNSPSREIIKFINFWLGFDNDHCSIIGIQFPNGYPYSDFIHRSIYFNLIVISINYFEINFRIVSIKMTGDSNETATNIAIQLYK